MRNFTNKTVREIAAETATAKGFFQKYEIDFCCGGNRNFYNASRLIGVSPEVVGDKIIQVLGGQVCALFF